MIVYKLEFSLSETFVNLRSPNSSHENPPRNIASVFTKFFKCFICDLLRSLWCRMGVFPWKDLRGIYVNVMHCATGMLEGISLKMFDWCFHKFPWAFYFPVIVAIDLPCIPNQTYIREAFLKEI